jgi:glycosyltransferase involved in cell wall biosynthesis
MDALKDVDCCLVIIGPLDSALLSKLTETGIKYESYVNLTPEQVVDQYALADIVCFVSLYEGFGLPIIEAQAIGRPVITSNISPMCDVASDAACLVDPYDGESIHRGIIKLINDEDYRNALVEKGYTNAGRHSPSIVARHYWAIYQDIALHS